MASNNIFKVNGVGREMLLKTLILAFSQEFSYCRSWRRTEEHGLILSWNEGKEGYNSLPGEFSASQCIDLVFQFLESDFASKVELDSYCQPYTGDGSSEKGWLVYKKGLSPYDICAIKPAHLHYSK